MYPESRKKKLTATENPMPTTAYPTLDFQCVNPSTVCHTTTNAAAKNRSEVSASIFPGGRAVDGLIRWAVLTPSFYHGFLCPQKEMVSRN